MTTMTTGPVPPPAPPGWPPAYGGTPTLPPSAPPTPQRGARRYWLTAAIAAIALALGIGGGITIGRLTAPTSASAPVSTPSTASQPSSVPTTAQRFTDADVAWCREYDATSNRLADAGRAAGAPRSMVAVYQPASAWTPQEADNNRRLADYLATWQPDMIQLRENASNPALKLLVETDVQETSMLVDKIRNGTYAPADSSLYRDTSAAEDAVLAACKDLKQGG